MQAARDHGGGLDAARTRWGGTRADWLDLSTGINPEPYPLPDIPQTAWAELPDAFAQDDLIRAARRFWQIPKDVDVLPAPGASPLIAGLPALAPKGRVCIPWPTYNEHEAAFRIHGFDVLHGAGATGTPHVLVNPNNPDGRVWTRADLPDALPFTVIDESFGDVAPEASLRGLAAEPGVLVLTSFGKFWGLAGLRLGFAIGRPEMLAPLRAAIGPWAVSGPAMAVGTAALHDLRWAKTTRERLAADAARLDALMAPHGKLVGGTTLFRTWDVGNAEAFHAKLAEARIWTRIFPYSKSWVRLGLPPSDGWTRLEAALC